MTALAQKCQSRVNDHGPCTKMPKQSRLATALHRAVARDVRALGRRRGTTTEVKFSVDFFCVDVSHSMPDFEVDFSSPEFFPSGAVSDRN